MKRIVIVLLMVILLSGCNKKMDKFYLDSKYYDESRFIDIDNKYLDTLDDSSYLLYTYNNYCTLEIPCDEIFKSVMDKYNISVYSLSFGEMKKLFIYDTVKYAPSIIIIKNNKVIAYLDANEDKDLDKYQDAEEFEKWLSNYVYLEKK